MVKKNNNRPALDPVTEATHQLAEPLYQDGLQPAVREIGKSLETVTMAVNAVLSPLRGLVWGIDSIEQYLKVRLAEKLKNVPQEQLQSPSVAIVGPAIEAMRFYGDEELIKDMFTNLLVASIDKNKSPYAHPSFVDIIKNLTTDEARIISHLQSVNRVPILGIKGAFKNDASKWVQLARYLSTTGEDAACDHPNLAPNYIDNLIRLGLAEIPGMAFIAGENAYSKIEQKPEIDFFKAEAERNNLTLETEPLQLRLTDFGKQFAGIVLT